MAFRNPAGNVTQVTCTACGKETTVPFAPTPGRPVFCRECFASRAPPRTTTYDARSPAPSGAPARGPPRMGGGGGGGGGSRQSATARQRMMAQGRKGHFMYDAREILTRLEGGMDEQHIRAFLEGLFARGARTSTRAAQEFLDEKVAASTITPEQRRALGDLVERYSFWR